MSRSLHLRQSAELLSAILHGTLPADTQMERYFRAHRNMGVRDRGIVAETVYGCLRRKRLLEHASGVESPTTEDTIVTRWLMDGMSARALQDAGYTGDAFARATRVRTLDVAALPFAVRVSLPDDLAARLVAQHGAAEAEALAQALNEPAPVDLRVNPLKATRAELQQALADEGYPSVPTPYSPFGLRRNERAPLFHTRAFKDGWFEVQDEGSQLVALLLEPRRGEMVVDFCAGAGGKALVLGALMANTGVVYAFDVSAHRLERMQPRLARAGLNNVRRVAIAHERDARVQRLSGKIDRVLVDVPCTGTGTLRRNPDIKWRAFDLVALSEEQSRILAAAAELLKPGGRLVYTTCSVLREENEAVVARFLSEHPEFTPVSPVEALARRHVPLTTTATDALRLYPHTHGTDGFYAALFERRQE